MAHDNSDSIEDDNKKKAPPKLTVAPTPKDLRLFSFLEDLLGVPAEAPDRLALVVCHGAGGMRLGHTVKEWPMGTLRAPGLNRERTIEICNLALQLAQQDCDALDKPTRYAMLAYDLARSDRPIGRHMLKLKPSGMGTALDDERGVGVEDDENNVVTTKLLLGLLESERKDKRWMTELMANTISGAMERDEARIERLEQIANDGWKRQIEMMQATQTMLDNSAERKAKADWMAWKKEKFSLVIEKGFAAAQVLLPALASKALGDQAGGGTPNPVADLLKSMSEDQSVAAFGLYDRTSDTVAGGVFTPAQFHLLCKVASSPDDATIEELRASLSNEQIAAAQQVFSISQLLPVVQWLQQRQAASAANAGEQ